VCVTRIAAQRAPPRELEPELRRVVAGVDDDRLGRAALRAHDVAVRPDRAELEPVDDGRHGRRV
jgi:hypothetical protein